MAHFGPETFLSKNGREITLRHCLPQDASQFLVFQPKIAAETQNTLQIPGETPKQADIEANWNRILNDPRDLRLGAFFNGTLIAQLGFTADHHPWTKHMGRFGMMVLQEFWGEGLGRKMLEALDSHARSIDITRIEALVRTQNERGVKLYTSAGYKIEGTRVRAVSIDGQFLDEYFIAKILRSRHT
jgi:RimJ/RimL family protein N-acetyltransferase